MISRRMFYLITVVLIQAAFATNTVNAETSRETNGKTKANSPSALRFSAAGDYIWCGPNHLALSHGKFLGIKLLNINNKEIKEISTPRPHQRAVACTPDVKYLFYIDNGVSGEVNVLDVETGDHSLVYSGNNWLHSKIDETPLSEDGSKVIVPHSSIEHLKLRERHMTTVQVPDSLNNDFIDDVAWSENGTLFILFRDKRHTKGLYILPNDGNDKIANLPDIPGYFIKQIEWDKSGQALYFLAWPDTDVDEAKIFSFEIGKEKSSLKEHVSGFFDSFELLSDGVIAFVQTVGVKGDQDYSYVSNTARSEVKIHDISIGEEVVLYAIGFSPEFIGNLKVSPDRRHLAFLNWKEGNKASKEIVLVPVEAHN